LDDRIISGNLVNRYVTRVKAGKPGGGGGGRVGGERKLRAPGAEWAFLLRFFFWGCFLVILLPLFIHLPISLASLVPTYLPLGAGEISF